MTYSEIPTAPAAPLMSPAPMLRRSILTSQHSTPYRTWRPPGSGRPSASNRKPSASLPPTELGAREAVPRESWEQLFKSQGMNNPLPRIRMLDGFNEGWIDFESGEPNSRKGNLKLETVLKALIERNASAH